MASTSTRPFSTWRGSDYCTEGRFCVRAPDPSCPLWDTKSPQERILGWLAADEREERHSENGVSQLGGSIGLKTRSD